VGAVVILAGWPVQALTFPSARARLLEVLKRGGKGNGFETRLKVYQLSLEALIIKRALKERE
jgi:hypothetical protein